MAESTQVDDPAVLRVQMEESREALAQKIEMLEEKVTETVQTATATVAEATETVMETVQSATASVSGTVNSVTQAVQGTVDNVRSSFEGTVDSVKNAFDVTRQVEQHPWMMMAGAVAVGFLGAGLLEGPSPCPRSQANSGESAAKGGTDDASLPLSAAPPRLSQSNSFQSSESKQQSTNRNWLTGLRESFGPEINKLEGLAVGAAMGALRDLVVDAVPPGIQNELREVVDSFTEKLGGRHLVSHPFRSDTPAATV